VFFFGYIEAKDNEKLARLVVVFFPLLNK
jgi:hypothetical protein